MSDNFEVLRRQLLELLQGGGAHTTFEDAVKDFPVELRGRKPQNFPHSAWMLLEHLRIAQWDILEFCRNAKHQSPQWPEQYWPAAAEPPTPAAWDEAIANFGRDLEAMQDLVTHPSTDLFASIPWGDGQNLLREALLVADHNAYHVAQVVDVRRLLGDWKD